MPNPHISQRVTISEFAGFAEQIDSAINAHGEWKVRLEKGIAQKCVALEPESIAQDNLCVLGQWLHSPSVKPYQGSLFEQVRKVHAEFHEITAGIVTQCRTGHSDKALAQLRNFDSEFNSKTKTLTRLLNDWKSEQSAITLQDNNSISGETQNYAIVRPVRWIFAASGFAMGLLFVFLGWLISLYQHDLSFSADSIAQSYVLSHSNFIIASAPLVLMIFAYFVGRFIDHSRILGMEKKEIASHEKKLQELLQQNNLMLDNIDTGFLLLGADLSVTIYSLSAQKILENTELAGRKIDDLFKGLIDGETLQNVRTYAELYGDPRHQESSLELLNPIELMHFRAQKDIQEKFIKARLRRITSDAGKIMGFVLIMQDITEAMQAIRRAETEKRKADESALLIDTLLQMEPESVLAFQRSIVADMDEANSLIKNAKNENYAAVLNNLFRIIHTVKGTSALFGFNSIANYAHVYEESIKKLKENPNIKSLDFLMLTVNQVKILEELRKIEQLISKFENFTKNSGRHILKRNIERYKSQILNQVGLNFNLDLEGFDDSDIPSMHTKEWTDIFSQLMRNSLAHGLENPEERRMAGKSETGEIRIITNVGENGYYVRYRDDGRSFDTHRIKTRAVELGIISHEAVLGMSESDIIELIFEPGFSTNETADINSGRGIGMDILRETMSRLNGKIRIKWQKKQYTEFEFQIPR